jgi:hypothetical protein
LFKSGQTESNLALCIPSAAQRYNARLPRHLSPEQVAAVLTAVRADPRLTGVPIDVIELDRNHFRSAQAEAREENDHCIIAPAEPSTKVASSTQAATSP